MSKVKITGNSSGTGVFTIAAPGTNNPRTITLPDSTGTILDENSSLPAANLTGTVATARLGTGTADGTTFLRGDQTYATPAGGAWEYVSTSSTGTSRSFRNIFSWSTYPCWMFVFNGVAMDNAGGGLGVQFYDASDVLSTSGYQWNYAVLNSGSSSWSVSNSNSDTFMHLSNNPSNAAPLWCNLLVWYGGTRNMVTADCIWDHTHGNNYFGRSVAGGRKGGFESTGIYFKQWAGVFQGGNIYAYRLNK